VQLHIVLTHVLDISQTYEDTKMRYVSTVIQTPAIANESRVRWYIRTSYMTFNDLEMYFVHWAGLDGHKV